MKKLLVLAFVAASGLAHADYVYNIDSNTRWSLLDSTHIVIHQYSRPMAVVKLGGCFANRASQLTFLTNHLGSFDGKIFIDGQVCDVWDVKKI
jgi:hypothetical protein